MHANEFFAHGPSEGATEGPWQRLSDHLQGVAQRAAQHAGAFDAADWGRLAGLWHDLGKYQPAWQDYLCRGGPRVEHSGAGAAYAVERLGGLGQLLAFVIAGHHAGLTNATSSEDAPGRPLRERLETAKAALEASRPHAPDLILDQPTPSRPLPHLAPPTTRSEAEDQRIRLALWTRFLFSALVDADFLDTEAFLDQRKAGRGTIEVASIPLSVRPNPYVIAASRNTAEAGRSNELQTLRWLSQQTATEKTKGRPDGRPFAHTKFSTPIFQSTRQARTGFYLQNTASATSRHAVKFSTPMKLTFHIR